MDPFRPPIVLKLVNLNVDSPCGNKTHFVNIRGPEVYMKGQTGPIRVKRGTYPTLKEPYENQRGAFGPIWARGSHWGPVVV